MEKQMTLSSSRTSVLHPLPTPPPSWWTTLIYWYAYIFICWLIDCFHLFVHLILCSFMCFKYRQCIHVFLLFILLFFFYGPLMCWHVTSVRNLYFWHKMCIMPLSSPSPSLSFMCTVFQPEILTLVFICNLFSAWGKYCTVLFIHTSFPTWWHSLVLL